MAGGDFCGHGRKPSSLFERKAEMMNVLRRTKEDAEICFGVRFGREDNKKQVCDKFFMRTVAQIAFFGFVQQKNRFQRRRPAWRFVVVVTRSQVIVLEFSRIGLLVTYRLDPLHSTSILVSNTTAFDPTRTYFDS